MENMSILKDFSIVGGFNYPLLGSFEQKISKLSVLFHNLLALRSTLDYDISIQENDKNVRYIVIKNKDRLVIAIDPTYIRYAYYDIDSFRLNECNELLIGLLEVMINEFKEELLLFEEIGRQYTWKWILPEDQSFKRNLSNVFETNVFSPVFNKLVTKIVDKEDLFNNKFSITLSAVAENNANLYLSIDSRRNYEYESRTQNLIDFTFKVFTKYQYNIDLAKVADTLKMFNKYDIEFALLAKGFN